MEIKQQLRIAQHQQLVMTPQLQQAIRILQLNRLELVEELRKEMDGNPLLVDESVEGRASSKQERSDLGLGNERGEAAIDRLEERSRAAAGDAPVNAAETKAVADIDWDRFLENRSQQQPNGGGRGNYEDLPPIEQNLTKVKTLDDHLRWQVQMSDFTETEVAFAELVIGNLDENGFLDLKGFERPDGSIAPDLTIEELAEEVGLDPEDAPEVLRMMQELDPVGVCARDLQECLRVQSEVFGCTELEAAVIERHLHNLERHNYQAIARDLKVPLDEVYEAVKEIQKLESRPARNFTDTDDKSIAISPDVYIVREGNEFVVSDNDRGLQRLYINQSLNEQLSKDPATREFIAEKMRSARGLLRAIEERRRTIIRVTECIVEKQRDFFEHGVAHLKPMILRDVAEEVQRHESTISRATTNKYVHTPQGLFELKHFFNSSIRRVAEEDIASESVKQAIKQMIEAEDKSSPLSDQAIVEALAKQSGIQIARRTVAKYREMLGILASSKRKKHF